MEPTWYADDCDLELASALDRSTSCSLLRVQVLTLAGNLLDKAQGLLKEGLTTTEVAEGYTKATTKVRLIICWGFLRSSNSSSHQILFICRHWRFSTG